MKKRSNIVEERHFSAAFKPRDSTPGTLRKGSYQGHAREGFVPGQNFSCTSGYTAFESLGPASPVIQITPCRGRIHRLPHPH